MTFVSCYCIAMLATLASYYILMTISLHLSLSHIGDLWTFISLTLNDYNHELYLL